MARPKKKYTNPIRLDKILDRFVLDMSKMDADRDLILEAVGFYHDRVEIADENLPDEIRGHLAALGALQKSFDQRLKAFDAMQKLSKAKEDLIAQIRADEKKLARPDLLTDTLDDIDLESLRN